MAKTQDVFLALVGVGDLAVEKARNLPALAERVKTQQYFDDFVTRGRAVQRTVKNSTTGKQILRQTDVAREQVREVTKSIEKSLGVNVVAWPRSRKTTASRSTTKAAGASKKSTARKTSAKKTSAKKTAKKAS